jgi:hypothetical protein
VEESLLLLTPKAAGMEETLGMSINSLLNVPKGQENVTLFLAVRAVDESGNHAELSNVVTLSRARVLAVPVEEKPLFGAAGLGLDFYLKLVLPPVFCLVLFLAVCVVLVASRRAGGKDSGGCLSGGANPVDEKDLRGSTFSLDLSHMAHMNYRYEGQYRARCHEDPETWSQMTKSRESLNFN